MKAFYANLVISILLIVGGFLVPPVGIIDGSVLTAVGLLLMFSVIEKIPEAIKAGKNIKVQKGDSSVVISANEPNDLNLHLNILYSAWLWVQDTQGCAVSAYNYDRTNIL